MQILKIWIDIKFLCSVAHFCNLVEEGKDIEDGGDGGVEMHMMPFSDDSDDEDEKQVDPYKEELENSVFQMQIWAVRQIMRQEMQTEINKISNVYNM